MHKQNETPTEEIKRATRRASFLPFHRPWIDEDDIAEVVDTLRSGWITTGPKCQRFEDEFAAYVNAKHAVSVSSCTAGLHLALDVAGVGPGDEVITSVYTFTSTAAVILHVNARPVFVDVLPGSLTMDPKDVDKKITARTKAIIPVHLAGHPCEMDQIMDLATGNRITVIEDAAHALPASYRGRRIGSIGDLTVFSFQAVKNLTTGEGGMITTDNEEYTKLLKTRRLHGINRDAWDRQASNKPWYYEVTYPGYKYNMTDINAALGLQQLRKSDMLHDVRKRYVTLYDEGLADLNELSLPQVAAHVEHSWQLYMIRLIQTGTSINRDAVIEALSKENIGANVHFIPLNLQPFYSRQFGLQASEFPRAVEAYEGTISLPLYPRMTEADVMDVVNAVRKIIKGN